MAAVTLTHRSVSQHNTYAQCAYRYKLEKLEKVWQRPAAWLSQGTAVHAALEAWERSGRTMTLEQMQEVFADEYVKSIGEQTEETPNFEFWFASGPYNGEVDIERRFGIGLEQCEKLLTWYEKHPEEKIWVTPDGTPAIELPFEVVLEGVTVKGFIDCVMETPDGIVVRDLKTGNMPGDTFQLATYAAAMKAMFGVDIVQGDYLMGKTGKPTLPYDLTETPFEEVAAAFKRLDEKVKAEEFPANPSDKQCRFCSVALSCEFAFG